MTTKIVVPELSESVSEATVGRWLKKEGDSVKEGEAVVELETDKVDLEVGAEAGGVLEKIARGEGEEVTAGDVLGEIDESADAEAGPQQPQAEEKEEKEAREARQAPKPVESKPEKEGERGEEEEQEEEPDRQEPPVTPAARKLADEEHVDLGEVEGTGEGGRIVKSDVERSLKEEAPEEGEAPAETREARGAEGADRPEERQRLSSRRRTIARRLVEAQRNAAMLTTFNEIDMGGVLELRERQREKLEQKYGHRLGIVSFFVKATVAALKEFPRLNAELDGDELVVKRYYDIGIAVDDRKGLVVPVLRNCDRMSLAEIDLAVRDLAEKARSSKLSIDDLEGGTFTITNGGVFGSLLSTPILNPPQVGILGLHKIEDRPYVVDGAVRVRPLMYVALSYDHRIIDGSEAVRFLVRLKELVELPESLLLEA